MQQQIIKHLQLNPNTGRLYWRVAPKYHPELQGKEAGTYRTYKGETRCFVKVNSVKLTRARIVYFLYTGRWHDGIIDHIDRNSLNDKPTNLRAATVLLNNHNHSRTNIRKLPSGRFQARLAQKSIGTFDTRKEAESMYHAVRSRVWGT